MIFRNPIPVTANPASIWKHKTSQGINSMNLVAGRGIQLDFGLNGTVVRLADDFNIDAMSYAGIWDFNSGYVAGQWVNLPYDISFQDQDGNQVPIGLTTTPGFNVIPTAIGSWLCVRDVPPSIYTEDYVTANVLTQFAGNPPDEWIKYTRFYDLNVYYPVFPQIPSQYTASVNVFNSTCQTIANDVFWVPIGIPATPSNGGCIDNTVSNGTTTLYVSYVSSGSMFQEDYLPYNAG